jgi:hypothetical protein
LKELVEGIHDEKLPQLAFKYKPVGKGNRELPRRDGKTRSWKRFVEIQAQ